MRNFLMSNKIFLTSDHHFGDEEVLTIKDYEEVPQRDFTDMDTIYSCRF